MGSDGSWKRYVYHHMHLLALCFQLYHHWDNLCFCHLVSYGFRLWKFCCLVYDQQDLIVLHLKFKEEFNFYHSRRQGDSRKLSANTETSSRKNKGWLNIRVAQQCLRWASDLWITLQCLFCASTPLHMLVPLINGSPHTCSEWALCLPMWHHL